MSLELGSVELLGADAIGQPGQRRFYLFARSARGSALMWMEKEQLNRLSLTLDKALAEQTDGQVLRTEAQAGTRPTLPGIPNDFPRTPEYDFRQSQMGLTYNERDGMFTFVITPVDIIMDEGQEPLALVHEEEAVLFLFTHRQAQELARNITVLISGGRPVCPLCNMPLDGGPHSCVKQNGHHEIVQIVETDEEEEE